MKKKVLSCCIAILALGGIPHITAQENVSNFDTEFVSIDQELQNWDPVRGKWLGGAIKAMSANQPIPDRTFPEDFSPGEMINQVPPATLTQIRSVAQSNSQNSRDLLGRERWNVVNSYLNRPNCRLVTGRSFGDPHLRSFDGESYSFQTVGEFILASSNDGLFEVQVRQEPQSDDFSLNTAVAMKVGGDRIGFYTQTSPGVSEMMLNGFPLFFPTSTYYLPHGGTVHRQGNQFEVTWPSGEKVAISRSRSGRMDFLNIDVQIYPCASNRFDGLLGNANGVRNDDFNNSRIGMSRGSVFAGGSMGDQMERERQAFLSKDFANSYRIAQQNSLFDYDFGQTTFTYTDYSYPRMHRSINDMSNDRRLAARQVCETSGLRGADLNACIFDQGFLNIAPIRPAVIRDRTKSTPLPIVNGETRNVNPPRTPSAGSTVGSGKSATPNTGSGGGIIVRPVDDKEIETAPVKTDTPKTWESREVLEQPVDAQGNTALPAPKQPQSGTNEEEIKRQEELNTPDTKRNTRSKSTPSRSNQKGEEPATPQTSPASTPPRSNSKPPQVPPTPKKESRPAAPAPTRTSSPTPTRTTSPAPRSATPAPAKSSPAPAGSGSVPARKGGG